MPVLVVDLHGVAAVVVARPARLLAEQGVLRHALGGAVTMLQLPGPQQLVNVLRRQALEILLHDLELLQPDVEELLVGHVADGDPAAILVHELLQPVEALLGVDVVRVDVAGDDLVAVDPVVLERLVDLLAPALDLLVGDDDAFPLAVVDVLAGGLRGQASLGEGARREGVRRAADRIAGPEQALDRRHAVVAPEVLGRGHVLGARAPRAASRRMRAHHVGLRRRELGVLVLRIDVGRRPQHRLADGHAEEVLPADLFEVRVLEGVHGHHVDGAAPGIHLADDAVVPEAGRDRPVRQVRALGIEILLADHLLQVGEPLRFVLLAKGVLRVGLEVEEVGADRAIAVLEAGENDAVLHLRHLGAGFDHQPVGRRGRPGCVPCAPRAFADRARLEDVRRAARAADHRLRLEDVVVAGADVEPDGAGDPVRLAVVHQEVRHADAVEDLVGRFLGGLRHDGLVGLAVDHDLPAPFAQVAARLRVAHDRQAPFLELVHGRVDVAGHVEQQILAHQPHQVDAGVADMVLGLVLAPAGAHVAIDGVEALGDRARTIDIGLLGNDDLLVLSPEPRFPGGSGPPKTRTDDQHVDAVFDDRFVCHQ